MILSKEGIYALSYIAGGNTRVFGGPYPLDLNKEMTITEMIDIGMNELIKEGLIVDRKPTEACDEFVLAMREYMHKKDYLKMNQYHCAISSDFPEYSSYIEEVEGGKYRIFHYLNQS